MRVLTARGYRNLLTRTHDELELRDAEPVNALFKRHRPTYVFLAAATVGGIGANSERPAEFLEDNLRISLNVIDAARRHGTRRLLNLGSSCIYPKEAPQPIPESALLTGPLEPTNEPYALAKIAALKYCIACNRQYGTDFYSLMPTNLYGTGDRYDLCSSHVLPALIARFHAAKIQGADTVTLWGDGTPLREFLYVDDLAAAAVFLMENYDAADIGDWVNVGSGQECSIAQLADRVRAVVFADNPAAAPALIWDTSKPNGTARKLLDSSRIHALGWQATTALIDGIRAAYADFLARRPHATP
jgi:GDP-L-fucose synthase